MEFLAKNGMLEEEHDMFRGERERGMKNARNISAGALTERILLDRGSNEDVVSNRGSKRRDEYHRAYLGLNIKSITHLACRVKIWIPFSTLSHLLLFSRPSSLSNN